MILLISPWREREMSIYELNNSYRYRQNQHGITIACAYFMFEGRIAVYHYNIKGIDIFHKDTISGEFTTLLEAQRVVNKKLAELRCKLCESESEFTRYINLS